MYQDVLMKLQNWPKRLILRARCPCSFLVWFVVLSAAPHNDEGGRVEDFNYSEKVKEVVEVWEIQHGAGCCVEIAPIWNVIKLVWLLASERNAFLFSHLKWKCIECFCWKIPGGNSRLLNICNTAWTVQLKWVLRWVIRCGFPFDISKVCSFWTIDLL